jgi:hypothetical protein
MIIAVIIYIVFTFIVASAGRNRRIGYGGAFLVSLLLSPLIGAIVVLLSEKHSDTLTKLKIAHESGGLTASEYKEEVRKIVPSVKDPKQRKQDSEDLKNGFFVVVAIAFVVFMIRWIIKLF